MGKDILVTRDGWRVLTRLNIDGFTIYTNVKSSCCTPETNTKLNVNYISKKKKNLKQCPQWSNKGLKRGCRVVWGQRHSLLKSLHWIKYLKHISISPKSYLTFHPNPNLRRVEELKTKTLDLDCPSESQHCHFLAVHPWTSCLTSLWFHFLTPVS